MHLVETVLNLPPEVVKSFALKAFDDQIAPRLQPAGGEPQRQLTQMYASCLVRGFDTADIGREIRDYKIDFAGPERSRERPECGFLAEVALTEVDASDRFHRQQVHGDDPARAPQPLAQDLAPASGRGAEVDDRDSRSDQSVPGGQLGELERGTRPVALRLRLVHPVVGDVLVHPGLV